MGDTMMALTLDLPQDLESELTAEAARLGLPLPEYARRLLAAGQAPGGAPKTGAELLAYWKREKVIGYRPDIADSQKHARGIRRRAERRARAQ
jgi:hypothetical protein